MTPDEYVTPRELRDALSDVDGKVDGVNAALSDHKVDVERRFGRIEKMILAVAIAVASPKLGGPDPTHVVAALHGYLT